MIRSARWLVPVTILVPAQAWALHVPDPYPTIQDAVDAAAPWDTIFVDGSRYTTENPVTITKDIIIRPEKAADTADTGADTGTETSPMTVNYPNFLVIEASLRLYDGEITTYRDMAGTSSSGGTFSGQAGIAMLGSGELLVENVSFYDGPGYAVYAVDSQVTLTGGVIRGFHDAHAVKVYSTAGDATLNVSGVYFEDNTQTAVFVADYARHFTQVSIADSWFVSNHSLEYGGDIWLHQIDDATITNIDSYYGTAAEAGGSIGLVATSATITDAYIYGASAPYAGAIVVVGESASPTITLSGTEFVGSVATGDADDYGFGGDMSVINATATLTRLTSTYPSGVYGGSIAALGSQIEVFDSLFIGGGAEQGAFFYGDTSSLSLQDAEVCLATGTGSIVSSTTGSVSLNRGFFQANTVTDGPMVLVSDADLYVYDNSVINNNTGPSYRNENGALDVINTLFVASGTVEGMGSSPFQIGYNLYARAGDGSEPTTLGGDVYEEPAFNIYYAPGTCGSRAFLAPGSPGAGQGYAAYDLDIGAFPVVEDPDDTGVVHTGIIETGVTDTDTATEPHTGGDDTAPTPDSDGDGTPDDEDCAPDDPDIHPGAYDDPLDDIDQDCDDDAAAGLAHGGCGCDTTGPAGAALAFAGLLLLTRRRAAG